MEGRVKSMQEIIRDCPDPRKLLWVPYIATDRDRPEDKPKVGDFAE